MPGTKEGYQKAKKTMIDKMGQKKFEEHMAKIRKRGGENKPNDTRGFSDPELASKAAKIKHQNAPKD